MADNFDKIHFENLSACDPRRVAGRTGCRYDENLAQYRIDIWHHTYIVDLANHSIGPESTGGGIYHDYLYLFAIHYLMKGSGIRPSGDWISEKDIMGGAAFFRGPHLIPVQLIVDRFNNDLDAFSATCRALGGKPVDFADAAFAFQITPQIPVAALYWLGDDDFPAEAKLLFDRTIDRHLPLDIVYALAVEICHTLAT